jgi:hypothetical protein
VTSSEMVFSEVAAQRRVAAVPLAHLSVELGHLYREDLAAEDRTGPEAADGDAADSDAADSDAADSDGQRLAVHFRAVRPWFDALRQNCVDALPGRPARVSTCFLIDDYFGQFSSPAELIPKLVTAAGDAGLSIDYLARESGCAEADGVPLAALVEARLVDDPPPGTTGSRPPARETGWLCNGQRSPAASGEALGDVGAWRPPTENGARNHSIFVDVELWNEQGGRRVWSCPFLAAVWQLLRLGLLRNLGEPVAAPVPLPGNLPGSWAELPAVVQLTPHAAPFSAYRSASVLASRFLPIELAVRTILSQVHVDPEADRQVLQRSSGESLAVPAEVVDRLRYVFLD